MPRVKQSHTVTETLWDGKTTIKGYFIDNFEFFIMRRCNHVTVKLFFYDNTRNQIIDASSSPLEQSKK